MKGERKSRELATHTILERWWDTAPLYLGSNTD